MPTPDPAVVPPPELQAAVNAASHAVAVLVAEACGNQTRTMIPLLAAINQLREADAELGAGVRAGAPASPDLRTAAADLVHALRYYGFSYNRDIVKQKIAALAQALDAELR